MKTERRYAVDSSSLLMVLEGSCAFLCVFMCNETLQLLKISIGAIVFPEFSFFKLLWLNINILNFVKFSLVMAESSHFKIWTWG